MKNCGTEIKIEIFFASVPRNLFSSFAKKFSLTVARTKLANRRTLSLNCHFFVKK